ncbi:SOS response-associated peptidase [Endozoicomonas arenosclerae]|uniref:SOS response-associated peptidase n=1 Tax=Endozoicomonas arenosclerae TaxID=1633495 RepID=UPI00078391BB|nr:SOS response-associated peptidase [Endozoicomonas arenosclerae]
MCGRYTLMADQIDLGWLGIRKPEANIPSYNVAPGEQVLIVRNNSKGKPETTRVKWGLVPAWLNDFSRAQINARAETAAEKPMFRDAIKERRCLILADGWFDWQKIQGRSQPWFIRPKSGGLCLLAGVWESYPVDDQLSYDSCAILTRPALGELTPLTERMPLVLGMKQAVDWLEEGYEKVLETTVRAQTCGNALSFYKVGRKVNHVSNKGADCVKKLTSNF